MAKAKLRNLPDLSALAVPGKQISVRVTPKAARDSIAVDGTTLRVCVTAAPEDGTANKAVRKLLARSMGISASALILKHGQTARDKTFVYDP